VCCSIEGIVTVLCMDKKDENVVFAAPWGRSTWVVSLLVIGRDRDRLDQSGAASPGNLCAHFRPNPNSSGDSSVHDFRLRNAGPNADRKKIWLDDANPSDRPAGGGGQSESDVWFDPDSWQRRIVCLQRNFLEQNTGTLSRVCHRFAPIRGAQTERSNGGDFAGCAGTISQETADDATVASIGLRSLNPQAVFLLSDFREGFFLNFR
jgi:hypothetical protein